MCDWSGTPVEIISGVPKDAQGIREALIGLMSSGVNRGATPYTGPLGVAQDPLQLMVANTLAGKMGYGGYKAPQFYGMAGMPTGAGISGFSVAQGGSAGGGGFRNAEPDVSPYDGGSQSGGSVRGGYGRDRRDYDSETTGTRAPRGGANPRRNWWG